MGSDVAASVGSGVSGAGSGVGEDSVVDDEEGDGSEHPPPHVTSNASADTSES